MSARAGWVMIGLVVVGLLVLSLLPNLPELSQRQFWADGATYYSMAWSLAEDLDLRYEPRDLARVRKEFPNGPQGIFLKRSSGGLAWDAEGLHRVPPDAPRVYFAKAFAYPLFAAPLVRLFGTNGLLLANALALGVALGCAYAELERRTRPARALAVTVSLLLLTVTPVYLLWLTPEIFNVGLIAAGLFLWSRERPIAAAILLGVATYSKPYNLFLALPLGVDPLLRGLTGLWESLRRGMALGATVLVLFGVNVAITGEANYQGGERKTFYEKFPGDRDGDREITFGNSGIWMTTNKPGPAVEGDQTARGEGPPRSKGEIEASLLRNLGYFWIGRFGGALPYYLPAVVAALLFIFRGPRDRHGALALAALLVSYLFYLWMIPDNWYGGGGTVGNRYFLNLLPLAVYLVPRGREWIVAGSGVLGAGVFLAPVLLSPLQHSQRPGDHATATAFRALPAELTMLNDLSVFTEVWRKKQPYGDTEGDAHKHWPADPKAYYLYFTDDGTRGRATLDGREGFWLRGGEPAEIILRALEPVRTLTLSFTGGAAGDEVEVTLGGFAQALALQPGETREIVLTPGPGFAYYDTFLHVLHFRSQRAGVEQASFVRLTLTVDKRARR